MFRNPPFNRRSYKLPTDKYGNLIGVKPIDQFNSQTFNLGLNGLPASDITLLQRAQSLREVEVIMSRLQEVRSNNPNNKGKTDAQIIGEMMPSWVQTPAEISRFVDFYNSTHSVPFDKAIQTDSVVDNAEVIASAPDGATTK